MNLTKTFSIRRQIEKIPSHQLSKRLLAALCIIYFAVPLFLIPSQWGDDGVIGLTFKNGPRAFLEPERISILLQSIGIWLLLFAATLALILLVCYLSTKILALFKITLEYWKIFNIYLYAKIWQHLAIVPISLIFLAIASSASPQQLETYNTGFSLAVAGTLLIPHLLFYIIFIYGLIRSATKTDRRPIE